MGVAGCHALVGFGFRFAHPAPGLARKIQTQDGLHSVPLVGLNKRYCKNAATTIVNMEGEASVYAVLRFELFHGKRHVEDITLQNVATHLGKPISDGE